MRAIFIVFYVILIILGVSFAALNASSVTVNFYFREYTLALSLVLLGSFAVGFLTGLLLFIKKYLHLKCQFRKCNKQLKLMEKEIQNLRVMPLKDQH